MTLNSTTTSRLQSYYKIHRIASFLILLAFFIFILSFFLPFSPFWKGLIKSSAEAALVGGIADWFAITALFKHPLGLPIPHTKLIPKNQHRIAQAVGVFVSENFLAPKVVYNRLIHLNPAQYLGIWITQRKNSLRTALYFKTLLPQITDFFDDKLLHQWVQETLQMALSQANGGKTLAHLIRFIINEDVGRSLLTSVFNHLQTALEQNTNLIEEQIRNNSWAIFRVLKMDSALAKRIIDISSQYLEKLKGEETPQRKQLEIYLEHMAQKLETPETPLAKKVARWQENILQSPLVQSASYKLWEEIKKYLTTHKNRPEKLLYLLETAGNQLLNNQQLQTTFNLKLATFSKAQAGFWQNDISRYVQHIIMSWDTTKINEQILSMAGRDLQFIRINGTLVGALLGCIIYLIALGMENHIGPFIMQSFPHIADYFSSLL